MYRDGVNIGGRETKCTPELIDSFAECIELGMPFELARQGCNISGKTYIGWKKRARQGEEPYFTFMQRVNAATPNFVKANLDIIKKASKTEWQAASWLLERKLAEFFSKNKVRIKLKKPPKDLSQSDQIMHYSNQILKQVAQGKISLDDAKAACAALEEQRKITETVQIKERVDQIESAVKAAQRG